LGNLVAVTDRNGLQINGATEPWLPRGHLADRWRSFGWNVETCDGHDLGALLTHFTRSRGDSAAPTAILAETVKAKGVTFMEGQKKSHHVSLTPALYSRAMRELAATLGEATRSEADVPCPTP